MRGGPSFKQLALGWYLISLGINYVPMVAYAIVITRNGSAREELGDELEEKGGRWPNTGGSLYTLYT